MGDRIEVPLDLADLEVVRSDVVGGMLEVTVESSSPRPCYHCGSVEVIGHGVYSRRVRDRSYGHPTVLVWRQGQEIETGGLFISSVLAAFRQLPRLRRGCTVPYGRRRVAPMAKCSTAGGEAPTRHDLELSLDAITTPTQVRAHPSWQCAPDRS
ncbi:MAG: hypothetical protein ACXW15_06315 [Acidimicrobiia bacterium]